MIEMGNTLSDICSGSSDKKILDPKDSLINKKPSISKEDFKWLKTIGRGSFGKVILAQNKNNSQLYAIKALKKEEMISLGLINTVLIEKNAMQNACHPFVINLKFSFQSRTRFYLAMDYIPGGDLITQIQKLGKLDEKTAKFYAAEVVLGIEYIHEKLGMIYRDLKPENILLDEHGHIRIADFGLSTPRDTAFAMRGTPQYFAPEMFTKDGYGKCVDWWSFGCLMFEMLTGKPPYEFINKDQLIYDILATEPSIPSDLSKGTRELLKKLFAKNPNERLGNNGAQEVKNHRFFEGINWDDVLHKKYSPLSMFAKNDDSNNFDNFVTAESLSETPLKYPGFFLTRYVSEFDYHSPESISACPNECNR
jgi:protein-serine/threonine kinase